VNCAPERLVAIGSHGQTLRHAPRADKPYSVQIGSPATVAARTGVLTVADFRAMDIAYGGEGAPLVPAFHAWTMGNSNENRVVVNIGGIANLTFLPGTRDAALLGYDTGPGNCLMDVWCGARLGTAFDADGAWAASGICCEALLQDLLEHPYFKVKPPKSTGREIFNFAYLEQILARPEFSILNAADVQATLASLTVETLAREIEGRISAGPARVLVCGGGARNRYLMNKLAARLTPMAVTSTRALGTDPDMVEACAFAWLAYMRISARAVRLTTGAQARSVILGAIYAPTPSSSKI
jgi:anhydro-N-acetylmuramic acid kinase